MLKNAFPGCVAISMSVLLLATLAAVPGPAEASPAPAEPQKTAPAAPAPPAAQVGVSSTTGPEVSAPGARQAPIQDYRVLAGGSQAPDPWELERLGVAATQAGQLDKARDLFRRSWEVGQLPTAPFNLACLDARQGKVDSAFRELDSALSAGFDDEALLKSDPDLAPLRGKPAFEPVLAGARRNRANGDAAVVKEGVFVAPTAPARAILVVLHEAPGDPVSVSSPFVGDARSQGLYLAAPRGPQRAGQRKFGWGDPRRAMGAVETTIAEARKRAGLLPVLVVGVGRGGTIAFTVAAMTPAVVGAASVGGPVDQSIPATAKAVAGLRGKRLFAGVSREASPGLVDAVKRGVEGLRGAGLSIGFVEWPGTSAGLPAEPAKAVRDVLGALLAGASPSPPRKK